MKHITSDIDWFRRIGCRLHAAVFLLAGLAGTAYGAPPLEPLPDPLFSFSLASESVGEGHVNAAAVLQVDTPYPSTFVPGTTLGLTYAADELDALSVANAGVASNAKFALLFSVDGETVGVMAIDPDLAELGVPYGVLDQAMRGQAAGDQFMSTSLFTRGGGPFSPPTSFNVLVRNNFDEGGTDYGAQPPTSAVDDALDAPEDSVDASFTAVDPEVLYYSTSAASPSLQELPVYGYPSGAHVFYRPLAFGEPLLYATYTQLDLEQGDDIDALIVFDTNTNTTFDGDDHVIFSLTPNSPSLAEIEGASPIGAGADVFITRFGQDAVIFASATALGLGEVVDNITALDYLLCDDGNACAALHGIRLTVGDYDEDHDVDAADFAVFEQCFTGPYVALTPGCEPGDAEPDGDIDCHDWTQFVLSWTEPEDPPTLAACPDMIPALSAWSVITMTLLLLLAGGIVIASRSRPARVPLRADG